MNFSASSGRQPRTQILQSELLGPPIVTAAIHSFAYSSSSQLTSEQVKVNILLKDVTRMTRVGLEPTTLGS